jgi:hypothetical protein
VEDWALIRRLVETVIRSVRSGGTWVLGGPVARAVASDGPPKYERPAVAVHFAAVAGEIWNLSAARRTVQPPSTINTARRRRPSGVKGAFSVSHEGLRGTR